MLGLLFCMATQLHETIRNTDLLICTFFAFRLEFEVCSIEWLYILYITGTVLMQ